MPSGPRAHPPQSTKATRRRGDEKKPRPPPHWFTLGSTRTFANRLRHPPPPANEERYFLFVAPRYNISLEDIVEDRHLPPLSLQDFEDYLRHVEGTPENLYFHLWVRHYRRLHNAWAESVLPKIPGPSKGAYHSRDLWERLAPCQDRQLKNEFAFAKSTFFDRDSPIWLGIDEEMRREVMHIANMPPQATHKLTNKLPSFPNQPEPGHFDVVLRHIDTQLAAAFERFLRLSFCNSGLWHACLGHLLGVSVLAGGLALWCTGITSDNGRGFVAASLPLIWVGVWFMLVTLNGHCLAVYLTGDARQLYPHEFVRPIPPDTVQPPVYSIVRPAQECPPPYESSRKTSGVSSTLLPFVSTPVPITQPPQTHQPWKYLNGGRRKSEIVSNWAGLGSGASENAKRRKSEGLVKMFGWHAGESEKRDDPESGVVVSVDDSGRRMQQTTRMSLDLPPARRTKDLPRQSLEMGIFPPVEPLAPPAPVATFARRGGVVGIDMGACDFGVGRYQVSFQPEEQPASPSDFTEENDFGIVVSEAFAEDEPYPYAPTFASHAVGESSTVEPTFDAATLEPMTPLAPGVEYLAQRRITMPDIFAPARITNGTTLERLLKAVGRGGQCREGAEMWPWPRRLLGPMTVVQSPVVRRAHWALTVRCALVALVATLGMACGMAR